MSGKKKKRTLKREITLLTMATSFGALVLFGTVMIVMFLCFSGEYTGGYGKYPPEYPSELSGKNAVYPGRSCNDPSQFYTAGFF